MNSVIVLSDLQPYVFVTWVKKGVALSINGEMDLMVGEEAWQTW